MESILKSKKLDNVCYDIRGPVLAHAKKMEDDGHRIIKLNIGNPAAFGFEAPDEITQDVIRNMSRASGYTESHGFFEPRKAIMHYTQQKNIKNVDVDDIIIGNGVSELIVMAMQGLINNDDEVLIPKPDYPLWTAAVTLAGGKPVHYTCDESADWFPDINDIESKITSKTRGILVINPNNPTGTILSYQEIESFINAIPESITIIIDEAYIHYAMEENYVSGISLSQKYKNVIVTRTFSKMYGLAGLRIGYAVGDRSIMSELRAAGNGWGISSVSCYAAMAALKDKSFVRQVKRLTNETKDYFYGELDSLGLSYIPSHSNFILVNVNEDAREFQKKLLKRNVRVRAYDNDTIRNYIRVSVGTLDEMQASVNVLKDLLKT